MLVSHLFKVLVKQGSLKVIDAAGKVHGFGDGSGETVTMRLHERSLHTRLFFDPQLALGEAYMAGTLTLEKGDIHDLLDLMSRNLGRGDGPPLQGMVAFGRRLVRHFNQFNPVGLARRHAAHHYDLSDTLYDLFLDKDRQYSCAYFMSPDDSLDQAQEQKKRHIAAKLLLEPGCRVLDIGSGWGGLALYLARLTGAEVSGLTLSEEQVKVAERRAAETGLSDRVRFHLRDYREEQGVYDRIVSVGMFEHVGIDHFKTFFQKLKDLLSDDGVALLHSIGRADGPGATNPWIRKYIFPGGYSPALSEVLPVIEKTGLYVTDIEILRLHYAETLKAWRRRFDANRARLTEIYDERFCRMWEFYLAGAEGAFRHAGHMVFQIQLAKRQDAVPLTRDYITEAERALARESSVAA
jgi:cyclopropane-fatty-acyl-phospholipid synthase